MLSEKREGAMRLSWILLGGAALAGAAWASAPGGYLTPVQIAASYAALPLPPAAGSAADKADRAALAAAKARLRDTGWERATTQVHLRSPEVAKQLWCAAGRQLSPDVAPAFNRLLMRAGADVSNASDAAKLVTKRDRPFVGDPDAKTCDPRATQATISYSYPSGHSALGVVWSEIATDVVPGRAQPLRALGAEFGDNRIICGVHYPSDVAAGRQMGQALVKQMRATAAYRADVAAAQAEAAKAEALSCG
jgi:acid phosphatase (class A)